MKKIFKKLVNVEVWKDFFDEHWRIRVIFWRWEIARFRINDEQKIVPVKQGFH